MKERDDGELGKEGRRQLGRQGEMWEVRHMG